MKVLVTGGGGFLGGKVVEMLLESSAKVVVLGRNSYSWLTEKGVQCVQGDLRNLEDVVKSATGCDAIIHVAAKAGVWGSQKEFCEINIKGTANVIQACLTHKIEYLVHTSSPSVVIGKDDIFNGDESLSYQKKYLAHYPKSKAEAEKMVLEANGWEMVQQNPNDICESKIVTLKTTALRPHLIWGPGDNNIIPRLLEAAKKQKVCRVGSGDNKVDITYIDNAAIAHLQALDELMNGKQKNAGKAYFIGDANPVVLWEWIADLIKHLNLPPIKKTISFKTGYAIGAVLEFIYKVLSLKGEPRLTRFMACQFSQSHYFSHENAQKDFNYYPVVDNEEGLHKLIKSLELKGDI